MPFQSEKQRRYLWANEPEIARDWTDKYGSRVKKARGGRIPFQYGSSTFSPGIEQILAQNNNFGWDQNVYKQNMLDQYTGIMSKYLPEGTANITSSPVFNRGFKEWNPSGFGSLLTRMALPTMSGTRGLAGSFPGSTGMTLDPLEQFIERAGGNVRQGELDWAETFGHEGTHLGWQYEPKKIGSIFGKDINIPGELGALSVSGKGGEEKWNYLHDLMYGSGAVMKEKDKRYNEYMDAANKYKKGEITLEAANKFKDKYYEMPDWDSTSLGHLKGDTDPGETDVTGKLVNPGDWSYTPQAFHDVGTSGLISEHKKALGVGFNPFEDTRAAGQWYKQQKYKKMSQAKKQAALQQRIRQHEAAEAAKQKTTPAYTGPVARDFDPKQDTGRRPDKPGGFTDPGKGSYGPWMANGGIVDLYRYGGF